PHGGGGEDRILRDHVFGSAVKILTNGRQKTTSRGQQRKPARTCGTDLEAAIGSGCRLGNGFAVFDQLYPRSRERISQCSGHAAADNNRTGRCDKQKQKERREGEA